MTGKRILSLLLTAALCLALFAACTTGEPQQGSGGTSSGGTPDGTGGGTADSTVLRVAIEGEPNSIFPNYQTNKICNRVDSCMYDLLVRWDDANNEAVPCLATGWEWIDDTHIRFTLRDDVSFTDGTRLTARDVLGSFQASADYTLANYALMFDIAGSEILDDTNFILALTEPYGNLLDILGCTHYAIFSVDAFEAVDKDVSVFSRDPVGSGPYKLQEWKQGESITLVRNDDHWDKDNLPYYETIVFSFIDDASSRVLALKSGDVQIAFNLPRSQVEEMESFGGIAVNLCVQNTVQPIVFNMKNNQALADPAVRRAILLGINKDSLVHAAYEGYSQASHSSLSGQVSPYYYESEQYAQDVEAAKQLIEESGWSGEDLTFSIYATTGTSTALHEVLQGQMAAIGVTINIETCDQATFLEMTWAGEIAMGFGENENWDINRMLNTVDSRLDTSIYAYVGEGEAELHALIDAAKSAPEAERYEAYAAVQQFCSDYYMITSIANVVLVDAWSDSLEGVAYDVRTCADIYGMHPIA